MLNRAITLLNWQPEQSTPLHHLIQNCKAASDVKLFLEKTDFDAAEKMSREVNDRGQLPVDVVPETKLNEDAKEELYSILSPYIIANPLKELSEYIDSKEILAKFPCSPSSEMYKNIELACFVANEARKALKKSHTHPQINILSPNQRNTIQTELGSMRDSYKYDCLKLIATNPIGLLFDTRNTVYEKIAERAIKNGIGNCGEFAFVIKHFIRKQNTKMSVKLMSIKNSDHIIPIIGEGENAVVCDAWAGKIYPASEIVRELKAYKKYTSPNSFYNVITSYNPRFHAVEPAVEPLNDLMVYLCKSIMSSLGMLGTYLVYAILKSLINYSDTSQLPNPGTSSI